MRTLLPAVGTLAFLLAPATLLAAPLIIDGGGNGTSCPGGSAVTATSCTYGGVQTFDYVEIRNGGTLRVRPYDGTSTTNTGNLVLRATGLDPTGTFSIRVDSRSRITAKGAGYRGLSCDNGESASVEPLSGGRGGCSVRDSGGGGGHFGRGGRGTKDCDAFGSATSCQFPQEFEESCGSRNGNSCTDVANLAACYGNAGGGDGLPDIAGRSFYHHILDVEFGAAGGDKGCRDGFEAGNRAGNGGGRVVLFAGTDARNGVIRIDGRISADGSRGCSLGNDSAGGGAGGTVLLVGDTVRVGDRARISAHGGRGGDSQPKCLPCNNPGVRDICQAGQTCTAVVEPASGRSFNLCGPCNCTPCTSNATCTLPGQTCRNLGGDLGSVCADSSNRCTTYDVGDDEGECLNTQNSGTCDDCGGGGGGGIINVQSVNAEIDPRAIFDVRGAKGGICPICAGEAGGGAGELQLDSAYIREVCDGKDNDFDGSVDEGLPALAGCGLPSCANGRPQTCPYDTATCTVPATDSNPRFALVLDTSGSMLLDIQGDPTFGDGSLEHPGVDTDSDVNTTAGDNSRLYIAKQAVAKVLAAFPENGYALGRYYQDVGQNRSCQTAANFECAMSCCSYDTPTNNLAPPYPSHYPDNQCILGTLYPGAGYSFADPGRSNDINIAWATSGADCINYAGSCGPPERGAQVLAGFDQPITQYLSWLDNHETGFRATTAEGDHCAGGDCELRGTGPTPLAGALEAARAYLEPIAACDAVRDCRTYATILLTDGAESCQGDPVAAATSLRAAVPGKDIKTYVIGFSVSAAERTQLNSIALAGGTDAREFGQANAAFFPQDEEGLANAIASIIAASQVFEQCNDLDDDCDGDTAVDFPDKGTFCDDGGRGACRGTGTVQCTADGSGTECVITSPGATSTAEVCNQLDDDCDGLVDEGLICDCTPSLEICDGRDNDCDSLVDEVPDISDNDAVAPIIGERCGALTAPNDQAPCKLGIQSCIAGVERCVGLVTPDPEEECNGLDDDCDGVTDQGAECPAGTFCAEGRCSVPCSSGEFPCRGGLICRSGACVLPDPCTPGSCETGRDCVNGLCVLVSQGTGGAGGGSGTPDGGTLDSGVDGGRAGSPGAAGGQSGAGASEGGGHYGLATGQGGCSCRSALGREPLHGLAALVGLAALFLSRRRAKGGRP